MLPNSKDIRWFKETFSSAIEAATAGTPFDVDMLSAIACQETGQLWQVMRRKNLSVDQIVALCCGDTLDSDKGRSAFPETKDDLLSAPQGAEMFAIARQALLDMADQVPGYEFAKTKKNKFCHGFGIFQYDLQFFKINPDYFLEKRYEKFENTLGRALDELTSCLKKVGLDGGAAITDLDFAHVAIAYNTGRYKPDKGLKQGHFDGSRYYGELIYDYLLTARTIETASAPAVLVQPTAGATIIPAPLASVAIGPRYTVDTMVSSLRVRREPKITDPTNANVVVELPDGHQVLAVTGNKVGDFLEIEAVLGGARFRGFAAATYLVKSASPTTAAAVEAPTEQDQPRFPAVSMPRKQGTTTKRTDKAGAHSLNEKDIPARKATSPEGLVAELRSIIAYLSPEKSTHHRYLPREGLTFCNIYVHDYCTLAGVYIPRVWWTSPALIKLAQSNKVEPLYGDTIVEMRANDLFRWLRDYGQDSGWRMATSTSELQQNANQGGVSLIVARRKEDGRSGHIVAVVPEGDEHMAKRNNIGEVTSPLQSQAGTSNFSYGTSTANWWKQDKFAESAFWIHA